MTTKTDVINEYTYGGDFYDWTIKTSKLLREGRISETDLGQIVEEIEDMGKSDKRALSSYLKLLMVHLTSRQRTGALAGNSRLLTRATSPTSSFRQGVPESRRHGWQKQWASF